MKIAGTLAISASIVLGALTAGGESKAETFKGCGVDVDYQTEAPAAGLSPAAASLYGVWVGTWDGGLCSALVVESVKPDGTVRAWYVHGTYSPWNITRPGKYNWTGRFSNNKLVFKGAQGGVDYALSSAGKLDGLYYNAGGQTKGSFVKK